MGSPDKKTFPFSQLDPLKPRVIPPHRPKIEKPLLQKRSIGLSRSELRQALREMPYDPSIKVMREERVKSEKKLFSPYTKYGPHISQKDVENRLKLLNKEKTRTPSTAEKLKIQHEINLLKKLKDLKTE